MKEETKQVIVEEIENLRKKNESRIHSFNLADLVMMQMVGDFDQFIGSLPKDNSEGFERADKLIEDTKKEVTVEKLFPSIVDKTITAQLGNEHASLRELGQNSIDAYNPGELDKEVIFNIEEGPHLILRARDFGKGMGLEEIVRDLLIPYNSGKEFDPTKIGEHGIGWYSIVDLAELVKVTSRKDGGVRTSQALVFRNENNNWEAVLQPSSLDGFYPRINYKQKGTEVTAFIDKEKTNPENIRDFLSQYLGMVDFQDAQISLNGQLINLLRRDYQAAMPSEIIHRDNKGALIFGASKREIYGAQSDPRFKLRNRNLDKILYTQKGLFIKYDSHPFADESIHAQLANDLMKTGVDLWVEVPDFITLTKGRNNIIADEWPMVLDAMYKDFESLFLDVLLNDEEMLHHPSEFLLKSVADLFDKKYEGYVKASERKKFSAKRRLISRLASAGSKTIDWGSYLTRNAFKYTLLFGAGAYRVGKKAVNYPVRSLPKDLAEFSRDIYKYLSANRDKITKQAGRVVGAGTLIAADAAGSYCVGNFIGKNINWDHLYYLGLGAAGAAGLAAGGVLISKGAARLPQLRESAANFLEDLIKIASKKGRGSGSRLASYAYGFGVKSVRFSKKVPGHIGQGAIWLGKKAYHAPGRALDTALDAASFIGDAKDYLLHKCGLYTNLEEKREKKQAKRAKKISKKYVSFMCRDNFMRKIMGKEIIPAELYYSKNKKEPKTKEERYSFTSELWDNLFRFGGPKEKTLDRPLVHGVRTELNDCPSLEKKQVKLSIENMIEAYLQRKLLYSETGRSSDRITMRDGQYFVDYQNPVVNRVIKRLEEISGRVRTSYDVKLLEDHLDNIWGFTKGAALVAYFLSGIGILHIAISSYSENIENPFENSRFYNNMRGALNEVGQGIKKLGARIGKKLTERKHEEAGEKDIHQKRNLLRAGLAVGKGIATVSSLPFIAAYSGLRYVGNNVAKPVICTLDPRKYPAYAGEVKGFIGDVKGFIKEEIEAHKERKEERRERKEEIRRIKDEEKAKLRELKQEERAQRDKERAELKRLRNEQRGGKSGISGALMDSYLIARDKLTDIYDSLPLLDYLTLGKTSINRFDKMERSKLKRICGLSSVGGGLVDFITAVENVDKLVNSALSDERFMKDRGKKPYTITLSEESPKRLGEPVIDGRRLDIDLTYGVGEELLGYFYLREVNRSLNRKEGSAPSAQKMDSFDYNLLDALLHLKVHDMREHINAEYSEHKSQFYRDKARLRRKVLDYMEANNIVLEDYINQGLSGNENALDPYYLIALKEFKEIVKMNKRNLRMTRLMFDNARRYASPEHQSKDSYMRTDENGEKIKYPLRGSI